MASAKDAALASEEQLRLMADSSRELVAYVDAEQRYQFVNSTYEEWFGVTRDQIRGQSLTEVLGGPAYEAIRTHVETVLSGREVTFEVELAFKDGRSRHVEGQFVPRIGMGGQATGFCALVRDITEHKRALQHLQRSAEQFRGLIEAAPDAVVVTRQDGTIDFINERAEQLLGYERLELVGQVVETLVPEPLRTAHVEHRKKYCDSLHVRPFLACLDLVARHKDGRELPVDLSLNPVQTEEGTLVICSLRDVTERKRAETALRKSEVALRASQKHLRSLTGKLLSAQEDERRRLARELHDDLTQRLAGLAIEAEMLERQVESHSDPLREKLRTMKERMVDLSEDVRSIARQLHPSIVDDLGLVDAIKSECTNLLQREDVAIDYKASSVPAAIGNDAALCLYRIVQEGLRNIAKHAKTKQAQVSLVGTDKALVLRVQDRGIGFDPSQAQKGTGLGLASMQDRVRLIEGQISIQSEPGQGTVIEVRVPLSGEHA